MNRIKLFLFTGHSFFLVCLSSLALSMEHNDVQAPRNHMMELPLRVQDAREEREENQVPRNHIREIPLRIQDLIEDRKGFSILPQGKKRNITNFIRENGYDVSFDYTSAANFARLYRNYRTLRDENIQARDRFLNLRFERNRVQGNFDFNAYIGNIREDARRVTHNLLDRDTNWNRNGRMSLLELTRERKSIFSFRSHLKKRAMIEFLNRNLEEGVVDFNLTSAANFARLFLKLEELKRFTDYINVEIDELL